jgi:hypothetical protein
VERILRLPCELQLALPFLHNPDQLYAHKILTHYSHEKGTAAPSAQHETHACDTAAHILGCCD